jgi:hypothetical protein
LSALLPTLLSGLLPALLPSGLVLISVCHKYISPSISIRFIDNSYGVAGADLLRPARYNFPLKSQNA